MKLFFVSSLLALGLLTGGLDAQVITIGGSVLGRPLAITGRTGVRFQQLPANVQQTIQSQAGGGVVAYVEHGVYSGRGYAVTFVKYGGRITLQFTENGSELSGDGGLIVDPLTDARTISFQELPPAIQETVTAQAAGGQVTFVASGTYHAPVYDALVQPPGSSPQHVVVTPSGGLLQGVKGLSGAVVNEAAGASTLGPPLNSDAAQAAATPTGQITGALSFESLGWTVQRTMLDRSSSGHIDTVQQLSLPDGRTAYRGFYTRDSQRHQVTVAQDGTVVSEGLLAP